MTSVSYTVSDSNAVTYVFPFEVLDDSFVNVTKNGVVLINDTDFTVNLDLLTITLLANPEVGDELLISRVTPRTTLVETFSNGARELAQKLNRAFKQALHVIEETDEVGSIGLDDEGNYNANNKKIVNVATPTEDGDASTKDYVDDQVASGLAYGFNGAPPVEVTFLTDGFNTSYHLGSMGAVVEPSVTPTSESFLVHMFYPDTFSDEPLPYAFVPPDKYAITWDGDFVITLGWTPPVDTRIRVACFGQRRDTLENASTASKLQTPRTIALSSDATGSIPFDGSANVTIPVTLKTIPGITPATLFSNANLKVDAQGRVTEIANGSGASDMTGANGTDPGVHGLVPAPGPTENIEFLRGDGTWASINSFNGLQQFTSNGSFTVPAGVTKVLVTVIGGGAQSPYAFGGTVPANADAARAKAVVSVTPGATISVVIGAGDTGGGGGTSSFGAFLTAAPGNYTPTAPVIGGTFGASAITKFAAPKYGYTPVHLQINTVAVSTGFTEVSQDYGDHGLRDGFTSATTNGCPGIVIVEW